MERIEGNRVRIIGRKLETQRASRLSPFDLMVENQHLRNYFREVKNMDGGTFQRRTCYIGGTPAECPKPRRNRTDVNISGVYGYRRQSSWEQAAYGIRAEGATEPTIAFAFDGGKAVRAVYFKESETLVTGSFSSNSQNSTDYLAKIMAFLTTPDASGKALLTPLQTIDAPAAETKSYIHMVELHQGEQRIVKLEADRKLCTTGCDPEFEYLEDGGAMRPSSLFKGTTATTEIGIDGSGLSVELRPKPFEKPSDTISYLIGIMERLPIETGLSVAGNHAPLGGHIHVGVGMEYNPDRDLVWLLDAFLGKPALDLSGRQRGNYKCLSQVREQPWGYEYRTPPSAIFAFPEIARISIKICKVLTECYINGQTMEINQPLQFEDYWNYAGLIPKEYEQWQEFLSQYRSSPAANSANVVPAWTCEEVKKRYSSQLDAARNSSAARAFAGNLGQRQAEAEASRAQVIRQELERARRRSASQQRSPEAIPERVHLRDEWSACAAGDFRARITSASESAPAVLFGLNSGRGDVVFGFDCDGFERIPAQDGLNWTGYGVPYRVRYPSNAQDVDDCHRVADAISIAHSILTGSASTSGQPVSAAPSIPAETFEAAFNEAIEAERASLDAIRAPRVSSPTNRERDIESLTTAGRIGRGHIDEDWTGLARALDSPTE
jgi:hypothetical protein